MKVILSDYDGGYHTEAVIDPGSYSCIYIMDKPLISHICDCAREHDFLEFYNKLEGLLRLCDAPESNNIYAVCCQDGVIVEIIILKYEAMYMIRDHGVVFTGGILEDNDD